MLVFGQDEPLAKWAARHIPDVGDGGFGPCRAVGMASPDGRKLWGVVVFNEYKPNAGLCTVSIASVYPRWATKGTIRAILSIPFDQYGIRKLCALIPSDNDRSLRLCAGLGFRREATLRHHFAPGRHGVVFSMMKNEFARKWPDQAPQMKEAA